MTLSLLELIKNSFSALVLMLIKEGQKFVVLLIFVKISAKNSALSLSVMVSTPLCSKTGILFLLRFIPYFLC